MVLQALYHGNKAIPWNRALRELRVLSQSLRTQVVPEVRQDLLKEVLQEVIL